MKLGLWQVMLSGFDTFDFYQLFSQVSKVWRPKERPKYI